MQKKKSFGLFVTTKKCANSQYKKKFFKMGGDGSTMMFCDYFHSLNEESVLKSRTDPNHKIVKWRNFPIVPNLSTRWTMNDVFNSK